MITVAWSMDYVSGFMKGGYMALLSSGEVAKIAKVSRDSIICAIRNGHIQEPVLRCGGRRYFSDEEVEKIVELFESRRKERAAWATKERRKARNAKKA